MSDIEWTGKTWNPTTGCTRVGPGCDHCYAARLSHRLRAMGQSKYRNGFELTVHPHLLQAPLSWKKPLRIFVNSMSDLFHRDVPTEFILQVMETCRQADWHQFQILTKRSQRLSRLGQKIDWPSNVWMGVSVESQAYAYRIDQLRVVPAAIRFVSFEPLIGPVNRPNLEGIDWAIVSGESGPGSRPSHPDWFRDIRSACRVADTAFFFKQFGDYAPVNDENRKRKTVRLNLDGLEVLDAVQRRHSDVELARFGKKNAGRTLDGQIWDEYSVALP